MEDSAKRLTKGKNGMGYEQRKTALRNYLQGWTEYFNLADMGSKVSAIDQFIRCGIDRWQAYQWGNTSKGYWRIAGSGILDRAIGDESLHRAGYSWIGCYYSASALPKG